MAVALSRDLIQRAPKSCCTTISTAVCVRRRYWNSRRVALHRPTTNDPKNCANGYCRHAGSDLVRYLEGFAHTTAVMQTKDHLERVAFEAVLDLARDGVVYAEIRFAPNCISKVSDVARVWKRCWRFHSCMHDAEIEVTQSSFARSSRDATGESE